MPSLALERTQELRIPELSTNCSKWLLVDLTNVRQLSQISDRFKASHNDMSELVGFCSFEQITTRCRVGL